MGNLSSKQEAALKQFKQNVADIMKDEFDDYFLLRWLRARSWDLKKSEKMLRDNQEWKKKFGTDTLLDWDVPEVLKMYYPGGFFGEDKHGCPIWIDTLGTIDPKGIALSAKRQDIIRYKMLSAEIFEKKMVPEASKKHKKRVEECTIVFDMEGIGRKHLWKPALDNILEQLRLLEANYPDRLRACFLVNAPSIFPFIWTLVKPVLSEYTKQKIKVLGANYQAELLKEIDADQLPVHWGGTATDPDGDPYCKSKICMGGTVPESYHVVKPDVDLSKFNVVNVARGSSEQITIEATQAGEILSWQFWTDNMDIGFGVFKRTSDERQKAGEMEEIVPSERVNCHIIPENGAITCDKTGTYVLRFDNTYSWVNAKKVYYMTELVESDDLEELHVNMKDIVTTL